LKAREGFVAAPLQPRDHEMIAMLEIGLDVRKVITHRLPAEKSLGAFEIMRRGESGKIVLDWAG
jgi:threonine 3-dehydrogenase